ncbi:MAG TPA: hypothetical protein VMD56_13425 [Steroidobacteraceae bacterium]|nr:hypothetical protein [Steroidobacteraceae bacterium]
MRKVARLGTCAAILLATLVMLSGCGLADTAVSGAAGAASEAQQAQQAKPMEQHVRDQIQAAQQQAAAQLQQAEKDSQ